MRKSLVLLLLLAAPLAAQAQRITLVDRIVAIVNKEVITASELDEAVGMAERELQRRGTPLPDHAVLERQMLERLVLTKAQLQLARSSGLRIDALQLDRAVERIAESNKMTLADFRQTLQRDGVSFDGWRQQVREQMLLERLRQREVDDKVQVSDSELDLYLEQTKNQKQAVEYNLAHILVRVPDQASPERIQAARERADKALAEARGGADFATVAASFSDAPDALQGGALGWRNEGRLPELFTSALAQLQPGQVSPVLRSPAGFHILKLVDRREAGNDAAPVRQTRLRHILIRTNEVVSDAEARRRALQLRQRIVNGEDFAEIARTNSDDASAARGGELDWVYPGDTVPEFERAYEALKVGEVSEPVRTPFGYHLIQVLERRTSAASPERRRLQARELLRERKADEAYQEWLRQLRDQT
ncbi:MAG TPA: peptidylprolyl isomerase, partial [Burkholderiales bacterium]|nr:peptidylprolyl isomerase [Burkholderiales bacterium]